MSESYNNNINFQSLHQTRSTNVNQKKQILWNILQPGDPYDIKKSLITKLPSDKRIFMGDNLQLVCFFQAAQIQRLIDILNQHKSRYKQLQRKQLDRHSYQIQIKELATKLIQSEQVKEENRKLKELIRKQTNQLEEWKKKSSSFDINIQKNYENALKQIQSMYYQNNNFKSQNQHLKNQNIHLKNRLDNLDRNRFKQIQEIRINMQSQKKSIIQRQMREINSKFGIQRNQLQLEIRRIKQMMESKNRQIDDLKTKNNQASNFTVRINEYQSKFMTMNQQISRLNRVLRQKSTQYLRQNQELKRRITNPLSNDVVARYEFIIHQIKDQNQRLILMNKSRQDQNSKLTLNYNKLNQQKEQLNRIAHELRNTLKQLNQQYSRINEYQNKIEFLQQEIQGLNSKQKDIDNLNNNFKIKLQQLNDLQRVFDGLKQQNENLKLNFHQNYKKADYQLQIRFNQIEDLRKQLAKSQDLIKYKIDYENQINLLQQEFQRLNQVNKIKIEQCQKLENFHNALLMQHDKRNGIIHQLQAQLQKFGGLQRNLVEHKKQIEILTDQNNLLKEKIQKLSLAQKKINEQQSKFQLLTQQIQKSNGIMRMKNEQIARLKDDNNQIHFKINDMEKFFTDQINSYDFKISIISQEYQKFRSMTQNKDLQLRKQMQLRQEQYSKNIQKHNKQYSKLEIHYQNLQYQYNELKNTAINRQQYSRLITDYENKLVFANQQIQRSNSQINHLDNQINLLKNNIQQATKNFNIQISNNQNQSNNLSQHIQKLQTLKQQLQSNCLQYAKKCQVYQNQIQRLNNARKIEIEQTASEITKLRNIISKLGEQYDGYKKKTASYQQTINKLKQQYDQLKKIKTNGNDFDGISRKLAEYDKIINQMGREIDTLRIQLQQKSNQLLKTSRRTTEGQQKNSQVLKSSRRISEGQNQKNINLLNERITLLSNQNKNLTLQIKNLEGNLKQKSDQINSLALQKVNIIKQYENKITIIKFQQEKKSNLISKSEIDRLNGIIISIQKQNKQLKQRNQSISQTIVTFQEYSHTYAAQKISLQKDIEQLKLKLNKVSTQNNNLNQKNIEQQNNLKEYERQNQQFKFILEQNKILQKQKEHLLLTIRDFNTIKNRQSEYLQQLSTLSLQNQRINYLIRTKDEQMFNLERNYKQIELERKQIIQDNNRLMHDRNNLMDQRNDLLGQRQNLIKEIQKRNMIISQYENINILSGKQIQKLNQNLENKINQVADLYVVLNQQNEEKRIKNLVIQQNQYLKKKIEIDIQTYETKIQKISQQNQTLKLSISEITQTNQNSQYFNQSKIQYQNKIDQLSQNMLQLNILYQTKLQQSTDIHSKYNKLLIEFNNLKILNEDSKKKLQETIQRHGQDFKSSVNIQRQNNILNLQNEQLRIKIIELDNINHRYYQYEEKLRKLSEQNQRLNKQLLIKICEFQKSELIYENLVIQYNQKIDQFEQKFNLVNEQSNQLKLKLKNFENSTKLIQQFNQIKIKYKWIFDENQSLKRKLLQMDQQKLTSITSQQYKNLQQSHKQITNDYQLSKRKAQQYQQKLIKLHLEFQKLNKIIQELRQQVKIRQNKQQTLQQKNRKLIQEIQRLNKIKADLQQQISQLRIRFTDTISLNNRINQHLSLFVILFAQIESLRKRVKDKERQVQDIRRQSLSPFKV